MAIGQPDNSQDGFSSSPIGKSIAASGGFGNAFSSALQLPGAIWNSWMSASSASNANNAAKGYGYTNSDGKTVNGVGYNPTATSFSFNGKNYNAAGNATGSVTAPTSGTSSSQLPNSAWVNGTLGDGSKNNNPNGDGTAQTGSTALDPVYDKNPYWLRPGETMQQYHDRIQATYGSSDSGSGSGTGSTDSSSSSSSSSGSSGTGSATAPATVTSNNPYSLPSGFTQTQNAQGGTTYTDASGNVYTQSSPGTYTLTSPATTSSSTGGDGTGTGMSTASTVTPTTSASSFSGASATPGDVTSALMQNIAAYAKTGQQTQAELDAQQALMQANLKYQADKMQASQGQLDQYLAGGGMANGEAGANTIQLQWNKQQEADLFAIDVAQQGLQIAQQNRQIRTQVAQQVVADQISTAQFGMPYAALTQDQKIAAGVAVFNSTGDTTLLEQALQGGNGSSSSSSSGSSSVDPSTFTSLNNNGTTDGSIKGSNILGTDLSTYSSSTSYGSDIASIVSGMPQQMTTASQIQSYINSVKPGSPITGAMVMAAALAYPGVSPKTIVAQLQKESQFATDGSAGAKMNNPGNVGNTDSAMANGKPVGYGSMQEGVMAVAKWDSEHPAQQSNQSSTMVASNADLIAKVKAMLPSSLGNGVRATNSGIPYIDLSEVPANLQNMATIQAGKLGIKAFEGNDAAGIQALNNIGQALNQMTTLVVKENLPAMGGLGTAGTIIKNWWGGITSSNPMLSDYGVYSDAAIKAVTALAGGLGSGLRLNTGTIENAVNNLPTQNDSLETAIEKIDKTRDLLAVQMSVAFGNPAIANGVLQYNGHSYFPGDLVVNSQNKIGIVNADGTITPQS